MDHYIHFLFSVISLFIIELNNQLISSFKKGNWKAGDRGLCALPTRVTEFKEGLELTIKYAKALECKR